jgi:hypothetical protein
MFSFLFYFYSLVSAFSLDCSNIPLRLIWVRPSGLFTDFWNYESLTHLVGLVGREICPSQRLYLHKTDRTQKTWDVHSCPEFSSNTQSNIRAAVGSKRQWPCGLCDLAGCSIMLISFFLSLYLSLSASLIYSSVTYSCMLYFFWCHILVLSYIALSLLYKFLLCLINSQVCILLYLINLLERPTSYMAPSVLSSITSLPLWGFCIGHICRWNRVSYRDMCMCLSCDFVSIL